MTEHDILQNPPRLTRFTWVDNAGITRGKAATAHVLEGAIRSGVGMTVGQQGLGMMMDAVIESTGLSAVGEVRLKADLETFTMLPHAPGSAMVAADMVNLDMTPWTHCPRDFLKRQLLEAKKLGLDVCSSFENEFYLFTPDGSPLDANVYATFDAFQAAQAVIDETVDALIAVGLTPEMYYPESGPGQQEIAIAPGMGLAGADRQVIFKAVVKRVAARHNLRASFAAKPVLESAGSGCHLHLSFWKDGKNAFFDPSDPIGLSSLGYDAIAGVLTHLPALCALTVPSVNSYRRLQPGWWAGAFSCYGLDNREASVRVLSSHLLPGSSGSSANFELKTCDASCNPYLALGGLIAVALDGIKRDLHPGEPLRVSPGSLSEAEREARGIAPLPASLEQSLSNLERDEVLQFALGADLSRSFTAVRQAEAAYFRAHPDEEIERHRYVY
jgi:glutamine synthetase